MEDLLFDSLDLVPSSDTTKVLDAGCGYGLVAIHLAKRGLHIEGIDIVERHVSRAQRNIAEENLQSKISVRKGDYHDLSPFTQSNFDGVYTMETLVHAAQLEVVLSEFFRVLKPGGHLSLFEYDHESFDRLESLDRRSMKSMNDLSAMPSNQRFEFGVMEQLLKEAGFQEIAVRDISKNVTPLLWLFYIVALIPYMIIKLFHLDKYFVNTMAAVVTYQAAKKGVYRYTVTTAKKPGLRLQRKAVA